MLSNINATLPPLSGMVQEIHGTYQVQYHPVDDDPDKVESGGGECEGVRCFDLLPSPHTCTGVYGKLGSTVPASLHDPRTGETAWGEVPSPI